MARRKAAGTPSLRVLFATSEIAPWVKTGGLGDVASALPAALAAQGHGVRVLVPGYPALLAAFPDRMRIASIGHIAGAMLPADLSSVRLDNGVTLLLLECPGYYERLGGPYQDRTGQDWPDNVLRFGLLSKAAALLASTASPLDWRPQVLHCNDWQTALAPAYLHYRLQPVAASVVTIHNLAFRGLFPHAAIASLDLPPESFVIDGVEFHGHLSFLKAGLQFGDRITTVSPTYAREICEHIHGFGLDGLLRHRHTVLSGILNGVDPVEWNPATDTLIDRNYNLDTLDVKATNKAGLRKRLGLLADASAPVLGMVSRMTHQKGCDLVIAAAEPLLEQGAQFAVLGSGESLMEEAWRKLAERHPGAVGVRIGFDDSLAHMVEAGSDVFLMPSRFEPCGLNQMYSLAYGTPPVVRATGGLADTVVDLTGPTRKDGSANGFTFRDATAPALLQSVQRAIDAWRDAPLWREIQRNGMARDFSWRHAVQPYVDLYRQLTGA